MARDNESRSTIQIHEGWGYDHLIEGFMPDSNGVWKWADGALKRAIKGGKKFIVLEEANRTALSAALGEVFSLIEDQYRGEGNGLILRSGERFHIPDDVVIVLTMNTIDKSTEEVDDALLGNLACVEFPPRSESLHALLEERGVTGGLQESLLELFTAIQDVYPLGHGYFSGLPEL